MNNVYEICFYGGLILTIIFLLLSIILFVVLNIPKVFGELTGRAAKKGIKEKQQGNVTDSSVAKKEQAKYYNQNTGKIKVRDAVSQETRKSNLDDTTDNLVGRDDFSNRAGFKPQFDADETAVLGASPELDRQIANAGKNDPKEEVTKLLAGDESDAATDVLKSDAVDESDAATDVLKSDAVDESDAATDVLKSDAGDESAEATDVLKSDAVDESDAATDVLKSDAVDESDDATDVLKSDAGDESDAATDVLKSDAGDESDAATDVLRADAGEEATDVLRGDQLAVEETKTVLAADKTRQLASKAKVIYNYVVVNTNESI